MLIGTKWLVEKLLSKVVFCQTGFHDTGNHKNPDFGPHSITNDQSRDAIVKTGRQDLRIDPNREFV